MDIISIEGMEFHSFIGCFKEEKIIGTRFTVDLFLHVNAQKAKIDDSLSDTVNYLTVYQSVKKVMSQKCDLLEHAAYNILNTVLNEFQSIEKATCKIKKMNPPLGGQINFVSFQCDLKRTDSN